MLTPTEGDGGGVTGTLGVASGVAGVVGGATGGGVLGAAGITGAGGLRGAGGVTGGGGVFRVIVVGAGGVGAAGAEITGITGLVFGAREAVLLVLRVTFAERGFRGRELSGIRAPAAGAILNSHVPQLKTESTEVGSLSGAVSVAAIACVDSNIRPQASRLVCSCLSMARIVCFGSILVPSTRSE